MKRLPLIVRAILVIGIAAFLPFSGVLAQTDRTLSGLRTWKAPAEILRAERATPGVSYLADSEVIGRVGDRPIRVYDFRDRYYASEYAFRPRPDSAGRVEFLDNLVNKEVLGQMALALARPLDVSDRAALREYTNEVLSNALFDRLVADSVTVTDREADQIHREQYGWALRVRHIVFDDRVTAERIRSDLVARRIGWETAVRRYTVAQEDSGRAGELGWIRRSDVRGEIAIRTFALQPGEISPVLQDGEEFHVVQVLERQPVPPPSADLMRRFIKSDIRQMKVNPRPLHLYDEVRSRSHFVYDTANVRFAVGEFRRQQATWPRREAMTIEMADRRVWFPPADTGRVLARAPNQNAKSDARWAGAARDGVEMTRLADRAKASRFVLQSVCRSALRVQGQDHEFAGNRARPWMWLLGGQVSHHTAPCTCTLDGSPA